MTVEQQIAGILAGDRAVAQWLKWFFHGAAFDVPDRDAQLTRFIRNYVLLSCARALHEDFDGGEISKPSRNRDEHRVGEVAAGSRVLQLLAERGLPLCAIAWEQLALDVGAALPEPVARGAA